MPANFNALKSLGDAIREAQSVLEAMRVQSEPSPRTFYLAPGNIRRSRIPKWQAARCGRAAQLAGSLQSGFRGSLREWERFSARFRGVDIGYRPRTLSKTSASSLFIFVQPDSISVLDTFAPH
jgi:hypothetical protein